jgi:hypothetical protein
MKKVSRFALAAMLSLGAASFVATPALAQKKDKKAKEDPSKPSPLQVGPEYRKAAAAAEAAIKAQDWAGAETQVAAAEALTKNEDEKFFAASLRLQLEAHKQSSEGMTKALDILLPHPRLPAANLPYYNFLRGNGAFLLKRYDEGLPYLLKARELGSKEKDLPLLLVQTYANTNRMPQAIDEMGKAIEAEHAAGRKPPVNWYDYIIAKVYAAGDRSTTATWLMLKVKDYPTLENWRKVIVLYRDSTNRDNTRLDRRQKVDLFRLMRATGALADQNDYVDYAQAAVNSGLPWETIAVVEEGRNSGKLPKTEGDSTKLLASAQAMAKNEGSLDAFATKAKGAATGKEASETGDAFLASGNYARALEMYDLALAKGSVNASLTNLNRGVTLFHLGRKDEAKAAFAQVQGAPAADVAKFWTAWIDLPTPPKA